MQNTQETKKQRFSPIVSVLGHVDHGKTSLLDRIRTSDIASSEKGGITQKIGASSIEIKYEDELRAITFIDTPGHEAFANMRSQGVSAADIVLLIVAADDGVMPQTKESIQKIIEAKIPFIVVFTKSDTEGANIERAKQSVMREGVLLEGLGGDVPFIDVSAKTGHNIQELLDLILLSYDMANTQKDANAAFYGVVIESLLDKRRGAVASVVVKQGVLRIGDTVFTKDKEVGKARNLFDSKLVSVKEAVPGEAVEIIGLTEVLPAGSILFVTEQEREKIVENAIRQTQKLDFASIFTTVKKGVSIVLKTSTAGEIDAIKNSLGPDIQVIAEGQGDIGVADVMRAKDINAIVVGFNVSISKDAKQLADTEGIFYRSYSIIYELLDEMSDAAQLLVDEAKEKVLGRASVLALFEGTTGQIIGLRVNEGRLHLQDTLRVERENAPIGETTIVTLKKGKEDVKEVTRGQECGAMFSANIDIRPGDMIISYR
ncbi:GTP-binding protein [Candidatus Woesebacteria bacterium]|nr:GTP-binding protein [Candidatus Woesebacteria bacterium]